MRKSLVGSGLVGWDRETLMREAKFLASKVNSPGTCREERAEASLALSIVQQRLGAVGAEAARTASKEEDT